MNGVLRRGAGAFLATVLWAANAGSAAAPAKSPPLRVPYQTFKLDNGLQVILHEDHSVPIITVNTWFHVGSSDEEPGRTGFAHLFEHVMFMGSQHVPTGGFDQMLEAAGGSNNGSTTEDRTNYFEDGPTNAMPLMMWLDSDRMGYLLPEITPEKLDLQRGVVQNERRQSYENQPYGLANENILSRLYPKEHPYHWPVIGSMADLDAATLGDVKAFFTKYYAPNNATICIAGDIDPARVKSLVTEYFSDIPRQPDVVRRPPPAFELKEDAYATLEDHVQVPRIYNSWHTVKGFHPDDAALDVTASILADGKVSRLYKRLVYELQIASGVVGYQASSRLDGRFVVYATARPGHTLPELQSAIDAEIKRLAETGPTAREVQRVVNSIEADFIGSMETVGSFGGKADRLNHYNYFVGEPDYFEKDLARYRAVTPADVQRVLKRYVLTPKRVYLSVVPEGKPEQAVTKEARP